VVCFDESPTQLIGEVRQPIPAAPGQIERYDYEHKRNGTANLFIFLDVQEYRQTIVRPCATMATRSAYAATLCSDRASATQLVSIHCPIWGGLLP
jgi:hypothetical protein